ncbi:hypothetical protein [Streptomyces sp. NPDC053069]|uniref:hypothetical protein n=1 Tax=Streptomyces sp. NPDC053069 TaxID=3365695 RepID=UPI0037D93936
MGLVAVGPAAAAPTRVVNCNENPYALGPAIGTALPGTTLQIQGRCIGPFEFPVDKDLTLTGGKNAVLDGNRQSSTVRVFPGVRLHLTGLTITNGTGLAPGGSGGGIYNDGGTVTLTMSTVSGNNTNTGGGIVSFNGGTLTLDHSTVSSNTAESNGGGILNNAVLIMDHSTVSGNTASISGGGLYNGGTANVTSSSVSNNAAGEFGGGIEQAAGALTLDHTTVVSNTAQISGGGIHNDGGTVTLSSTRVRNNAPDNCAPPNTVPGCTG